VKGVDVLSDHPGRLHMKKEFDLNQFSQFPIPSFEEWKTVAEKSLKGKPLEKLNTTTYEGIELKTIYTKKDVQDIKHINNLPGEGSFHRGNQRLGYREKPWHVCQEITAATAADFNEKLKYDLKRGQTMIHLKADKATINGIDIDKADEAQIGNEGIPLTNAAFLEKALKDIDLRDYPIMIQSGVSSTPIFSFFITYLQKREIALNEIEAYVGADPITNLVTEGKSRLTVNAQYNQMAEIIKWNNRHDANIRVIQISADPWHDAGTSADQELAFALASAVDYIRAMLDKDLHIDEIAKHLYFPFSIGSQLFMEIAKLRAARLLFSRIIGAFGGNEQSQKMYIHGRTSQFTKTKYDPYVNMLRTTTEAFSAVAGGVDSLHVSPFDEVIREGDDFSRRIARNTQTILREESHLDRVVDPAGGSWFVESLTDQLAKKAWQLFQEIEKKGGMLAAVKEGYPQGLVKKTAEQRISHASHRKDRIVGTNMYPNLEEKPLSVVNKAKRDEDVIIKKEINKKSFDEIEPTLDNLIEMAAKGATVSDILTCYQTSDSEETVPAIKAFRVAEPFEKLRDAAIQYKQANGHFPKVFFINLGAIPKHKARADFSLNFFAAGGFEAEKNDGYHSVEEAVQAVLSSNLSTVVINGSDDQYEQLVPEIARLLKQEKPEVTIFVAGKQPSEVTETFNKAGVDGYIHIDSNCYETLRELQQQKGVIA
jgi:methylmalonyl-CoA mutase